MNTYHDRQLEVGLRQRKSKNKVRLIFGARQTGKTRLLQRLLSSDNSVIFNLQDSTLRRKLESAPSAFRDELGAMGKRIVNVGVDEIQKVPDLLDEIQLLYDENPTRWQFFVTGSSARKLRSCSANLLPGRCHMYHLYPVMRSEENDFDGRLKTGAWPGTDPFPDRTLHRRLMHGNLPGVLTESSNKAEATLDAYVGNYLEEEIRREGLVKNMGAFNTFLGLAALESGNQMNLTGISQESGIPVSTLSTFYQVLVDTFVGYWVRPYGRPGRKRLLTTPRFLFFDLGVRNAAAGMHIGGRELPPDSGGRLLEHWVGVELLHRAMYAGRGYSVSFWHTKTGAEVDFIWQQPDRDIPVEVKWTENPQRKDARHVETFLDLYSNRATQGYVVCRVPRARQLSERVTAIPWQEL